jgi:hypothetical protein
LKDSDFVEKVQQLVYENVLSHDRLASQSERADKLLKAVTALVGIYNTECPSDVNDYAVAVDPHRGHNVGESDYASHPIQPWDCWVNWGLTPWDADILKRTVRTKDVPGLTPKEARIQDYEKIKHICDERISQISKGDPYYKNLRIPAWVDKD